MFTIRRAQDVNCEKCSRLVARQLKDQLQIKAGKVFVHTRGPASVGCWNCGHVNLMEVADEIAIPMAVMATDTA